MHAPSADGLPPAGQEACLARVRHTVNEFLTNQRMHAPSADGLPPAGQEACHKNQTTKFNEDTKVFLSRRAWKAMLCRPWFAVHIRLFVPYSLTVIPPASLESLPYHYD
jgi:hypothetical protein